MAVKRKLKLKNNLKKPLIVVGVVLILILIFFLFYSNKRNSLIKIGYSKEASSIILKKFKYSDVIALGENKTLNKAFESSNYKEENYEAYKKIKYQDHKDLIKNINTLLSKGYKNNEISLILSRGSNDEVVEFAKRDKVKYLEEFFSISYSKLSNYDRYVKYQDLENNDAEITVLSVELDFDQEEYVNVKNIDIFDKYTLVNKHRMLTEDYTPDNLRAFPSSEVKPSEEVRANSEVVKAFHEMREAASKEGLDLLVNSGYRSYKSQDEINNLYKEAYGQGYVDKYMVRTGYSEHQTGMSIDVASGTKNVFLESDEYSFMMDNAYKYGFILRYPKSKEDITGYRCEPWHYRYVGKKIAKYIKENNITYDEYYIMFLNK